MTKEGMNAALLSDGDVLRGIIDAVPHPIFVKDEQSRFVVVNDAMCRLMGRRFSDLVGKLDEDFVPKEQADIYLANDRRVLLDGMVNENEEPFTDGEGELRTIVTRKKRFVLPTGKPLLVGCITDISDFRRAEAAIRHHAEHDYLTGLANRSLFTKQLEAAVSERSGDGRSAALLLIDLDGFKAVNDVLGHTAGDNILVQTANALSDIVGDSDIDGAARLGGDEFAIVQRPALQPLAAISCAEAVVSRLSSPIFVNRERVAISASVGVAFAAETPHNRDALIHRADLALYAAKHEGRGRWRLFDKGMQATEVAA